VRSVKNERFRTPQEYVEVADAPLLTSEQQRVWTP